MTMKNRTCTHSSIVIRQSSMTLALPLFVLGIGTLDPHHSFAANHLALIADLLDGRSYLHAINLGNPRIQEYKNSRIKTKPRYPPFSDSRILEFLDSCKLFIPIDNSSPRQIVRGELDQDLVAGQDANEILTHLSGDMSQHHVFVLQFYTEHSVGKGLNHCSNHLNGFLFRHMSPISFLLLQNTLTVRSSFCSSTIARKVSKMSSTGCSPSTS